MPVNVPNLDDRTYDDLVREAISLIPRHAPEWTDHNASDPGITLIELLAYTVEQLVFRLNRVGRPAKQRFLALLRGVPDLPERLGPTSADELERALRQAVAELRIQRSLVTPGDYAEVTLRSARAAGKKLARAQAFPGWDLERPTPGEPTQAGAAHTSIVLVPSEPLEPEEWTDLLDTLRPELENWRLLTNRIHLTPPRIVAVRLAAEVWLRPGFAPQELGPALSSSIRAYFAMGPGGGPDGAGWPFGRPLYLSEIYQCLDGVEGVEHVESVRVMRVAGDSAAVDEATLGIQIGMQSTVGSDTRLGSTRATRGERYLREESGRLFGIALEPYELLAVELHPADVVWRESQGPAAGLPSESAP